jgi:soluble lytic murein transglycosylase-like protein
MRNTFASQAAAWLGSALLAVSLLSSGAAHAGNQKEEALADSVRLALERAIRDGRPPKPVFRDDGARMRYQQWFDAMSARLKRRLPDDQVRTEFLDAAWYEATRAGLDPGLVLGLVQVESAYRKYAV